MADGLNRVTLLGNLGADPELRYSQSGGAILKLRLATTESFLGKDNQKQERTEWHSCTVFGKRAEGLAKFLQKGTRILVEGAIRTSSWDDKDGNKRYRTEIAVNNIVFCGGGAKDGAQQGTGSAGQSQQQQPRPVSTSSRQQPAPPDASDIPPDDFPTDDADLPF